MKVDHLAADVDRTGLGRLGDVQAKPTIEGRHQLPQARVCRLPSDGATDQVRGGNDSHAGRVDERLQPFTRSGHFSALKKGKAVKEVQMSRASFADNACSVHGRPAAR